ncbi:MAG: threonine/serine dehydratase [Planctomycetota bacterium]
MPTPRRSLDWKRFDSIRIEEARARLEGVVLRTPLVPIRCAPAIELRAKLENRQETGSFKARGAWNQVSQLDEAARRSGVVCPSSGNHGKALAWAARRAGVPATIVMPANAYPNKIEACRSLGAQVVLAATREAADEECAKLVERGWTLVHPYDAERTIQGAGTVGLEIAEEWPEVDVVVVPVGGGGLISGVSLALRQSLGDHVKIVGAEPRGAPSLTRGLEAGRPVVLASIESRVQGLTPLYSGQRNIDICRATVDRVVLFEDEAAFAAQKRLVEQGETVEPAGAAAAGLVFGGLLPPEIAQAAAGRTLRVAVVVSGGNPDPAQLASVQAEIERERSAPAAQR